MAEDIVSPEGDDMQTVYDQQGQEAAGVDSPVQDDWADLGGPEEDDESSEFDEGESDNESVSSEGDESPATAEGDGSEEDSSESQAEGEGQEEAAEVSEEEAGEEQPAFDPEVYKQQRQQVIDEVSQHYQLSDEEADKLLESPNEVLPKLAGRLFTDVYEAAVRSVQQQLPQMLQQHEGQKQAQEKAKNEFYSKWPKLEGHEQDVERLAAAYRQANPDVPRDQFIRDVGAQAHWALGIPVEDQPQPAPEATTPHKPANPNTAGAPAPAAQPANEFADLAMDEEPY